MFGRKKDSPPTAPPSGVLLRCSFCNKSQRDVRQLIAGPNVQICDECVDIAMDLVAHAKAQSDGVSDRVDASPRPPSTRSALMVCALCHMITSLEESVAVPERGSICPGCVGAFEAALAERDGQA